MKHSVVLASLICLLGLNAHATATRETGGVPPAPRAVVIQGHATDGQFDLAARGKFLQLAAQHLAEDRVEAVTQRRQLQDDKKTYLCIEYKTWEDTLEAKQAFRTLLASHSSVEVVDNGGCR